jgi:hypothetical protein
VTPSTSTVAARVAAADRLVPAARHRGAPGDRSPLRVDCLDRQGRRRGVVPERQLQARRAHREPRHDRHGDRRLGLDPAHHAAERRPPVPRRGHLRLVVAGLAHRGHALVRGRPRAGVAWTGLAARGARRRVHRRALPARMELYARRLEVNPRRAASEQHEGERVRRGSEGAVHGWGAGSWAIPILSPDVEMGARPSKDGFTLDARAGSERSDPPVVRLERWTGARRRASRQRSAP